MKSLKFKVGKIRIEEWIIQNSKAKDQKPKTKNPIFSKLIFLLIIAISCFSVSAQNFQKEFSFSKNGSLEVVNFYGKVKIEASDELENQAILNAQSSKTITDKDFSIKGSDGKLKIEVNQQPGKTRIDLTIKVPERIKLKVETEEGEVAIEGNIASAEVKTDTGTIATNIPLENLKYNFLWNQTKPRFLSDIQIEEPRERSGGRFTIDGKYTDPDANSKKADDEAEESKVKGQKSKTDNLISLNFSTYRGIILLNVDPNEVSSDLREHPLTEAAKAIVKSGDSILTDAIRRASPKHFGDYQKTLPPRQISPILTDKPQDKNLSTATVKQVVARVMDVNNRAVGGLEKSDFVLTEKGIEREILDVKPVTAPFNLVLMLDVSGSIETYVNFIRKAARNFLNTMSPQDKISILIFNENIKQISTFTTDRQKLSESLDTFDAGGGTAYYDALAYTLVDTLKPFKGERTAVVILSDGDDNRSFLPFESLIGSIQESGALIYPLYVPSTLVAASATNNPNNSADPLRTRYMGLTSKSESEGARLAQVSGGVYYSIRRLDELQKAYEDIVVQLRTAYTITYRSNSTEEGDSNSPNLRVRINRDGTFVNLGKIMPVSFNQPKFPKTKTVYSAVSFNYANQNDYFNFSVKPVSFNSDQQLQIITGEIDNIKYNPLLTNDLKRQSKENFDINKSPPAFLYGDLAVSRWISPKRTRSYPYERIYNTLKSPKRTTIIPIIKDEGKGGDRDFLQFDTISMMNLLDVYVILGYYNDAARSSSNRLTEQMFDNALILSKLNELENFKGTASEWNLKELNQVSLIAEKAKTAYAEIAKRTNVTLSDERGIDNFIVRISKSLDDFRQLSREKAKQAQNRESLTLQPKEALSSDTKGRITIADKSGGMYFFTCDETKLEENTLTLMEAKHTSRAKMPSASDIKDGLLKMMLYTNLRNVKIGNQLVEVKVAIRLTSNKLEGSISSNADMQKLDDFLQANKFTKNQTGFVKKLFEEARENDFEIILEFGETQ